MLAGHTTFAQFGSTDGRSAESRSSATAPTDAGLASGLINKQIGGTLGVAVPSSIATSATIDAIASGDAVANALTGFQAAFIGAAIALVGILVSCVARTSSSRRVDATPALEAA